MSNDPVLVSVFRCGDGIGISEALPEVLVAARFWDKLDQVSAGRNRAEFRILIKPDLGGFEPDSLLATSPLLVEALIDLLHDRGLTSVAVGTAPDGAACWAANRDVFALFDLMGYKFATPKGRAYDVVDLSEDLIEGSFPIESSLRDCKLAAAWLKADYRIVFAKCKTDEADGYSLCMGSILDVLPEQDKNFYYRQVRSLGEVISDVLALKPVEFALIDALTSAHGTGGRRAPRAIATQTLIASSNIVLADFVCALKMGLDPYGSRAMQSVLEELPLPPFVLKGDTRTFEDWENVTSALVGSRRYREGAEYIDRLLEPWLQRLDPDFFALKRPLDATLNKALSTFFGGSTHSPTADLLLLVLNLLVGAVGHISESFRTMADKESIRQRVVNLGFDPKDYDATVFDQIETELDALELLAIQAPERAPGLRWRMIDKAVVFSFEREIAIDYDLFISKVDVANVIQYMNDYLGGVVVPLARDDRGRPTRQAERNIYLPQPNYLVLFHGKPIDVSKLECAQYEDDRRSLYWKTVESKNGSAVYDDGRASFIRTGDGNTAVSIIGRQLFRLPLFWQVVDLDLVPELKAPLVTDAYRTFFDRTMSNFEALVEGRDIRMGLQPDAAPASESDEVAALLERVSRAAAPLLATFLSRKQGGSHDAKDANGFVHGLAPGYVTQGDRDSGKQESFPQLVEFIAGLRRAMARDLAAASKQP